MIRAMLWAQGECTAGDTGLLQTWRQATDSCLWLDIEGEIGEPEQALLAELGCDPLAISDCRRQRHPPKIEIFDASTFILFRGIARLDERLELEPQQLGIWVGSRLIITVHRGPSVSANHLWDDGVAARLLAQPAAVALELIHYASGRYLERLLAFEERLGDLEDGMLSAQSERDMKELVSYRSRLRKLRRIFSYHRGLAHSLWVQGSPHLGEGDGAHHHLRRDVYDRCERLYSLGSMYYEICGDLIEGYISISSHNLNQTVKVLTIISAIFVPLTFLAGIYGMNFEYMPELGWRYAYFALLGVMALIAGSLYLVFRRIRWL